VVAVSAPVDWVPLTARLPLQPPLALQEVALVADQLSVEALPDVTDDGFALKDTVGAAAEAVTVVVCAAVPPGPVHDKVKD
jgi:hypothetical protein